MTFRIDLSHEEIEKITSERLRSLKSHNPIEEDFYDRDFSEDLEFSGVNDFEAGFMQGYLG